MTLLIGSITIGLILALLALGIFISFRVFDFPDITAEGSFTFGAAITASLIVAGTNPVVATMMAFLGGLLAGCCGHFDGFFRWTTCRISNGTDPYTV